MDEVTVLEELEMFGSSQWGLVTSGQARDLGVDRLWLSRMSARGRLQRVRHGVYALPSARFGPWQDLQAAWLATDASSPAESRIEVEDPVVVSHESAAGVHGLGELIAVRHEFSSPARRQTTQKDLLFHRCEVPARDITWVEGLPVTSVARTVGDLAAQAIDVDHLATVVRDAVEDHHVPTGELAERLFPHIGDYGAASGRELVHSLLKHAGYSPDNDPAVNKVGKFLAWQLRTELVNSTDNQARRQASGAVTASDLMFPARASELKEE